MNVRRQRGSALIEAAAVLPVFALLICAAIDVARTFQLGQITAGAARAGIHRALVDPVDLKAVEAAATADAGLSGFTAKATRVDAYVRVETGIEMKPLLRSPTFIRSEAQVRVE